MNHNWTKQELRAAVKAYVKMRDDETKGIPFVKKRIYANLADKFNRSEKSFEYRMQNISYVYALMGRTWVSGLKPAKNVGSKNVKIIEELIAEAEGQFLNPVAEFESQVLFYKSQKVFPTPTGIKSPEKTSWIIANYMRDPKVKAWILKEADGQCECCGCNAPFETIEGEPFLEVHHIRHLSDGGSDTVTNTIAVCPNCHREMHYGIDRFRLIALMFEKIPRLVPE